MHFVVVSAALTWFVSMFQNVYKQKPRPSQEFFYGFDLSCISELREGVHNCLEQMGWCLTVYGRAKKWEEEVVLPSPPKKIYHMFTPPHYSPNMSTSPKISRKNGKIGYFCMQYANFFRKSFNRPQFWVSAHILCNMIIHPLQKKSPNWSPPPFIFWVTQLHPSHFLDLPSSLSEQKNQSWSTPPKKFI